MSSNDVWQTFIKGLIMAIMKQISTAVEKFSRPLIVNIISKNSRMDIDCNLYPMRVFFLSLFLFFFKPTLLTLVVSTPITHRSCLVLDPATPMTQLQSTRQHEAALYYCLLCDLLFTSHPDVLLKQ